MVSDADALSEARREIERLTAERDLAVRVEAEVSGERPRACVVAICTDAEGRVLLGQRLRRDNGYGKWVLPGGGIKGRETFEEALRREVREECGIEIDLGPLVLPYRHIDGPTNNVALFFHARYASGALVGGDDLAEPHFFTRKEIAALDLTPATHEILALAADEPIKDTYACQRCGRRDGLDAVCNNDTWATISEGRIAGPAGEVVDGRWNLLCLWCIDELAHAKGMTFPVTLHFAGRAVYGGSPEHASREANTTSLPDEVAKEDAGNLAIVERARRIFSTVHCCHWDELSPADRTAFDLAIRPFLSTGNSPGDAHETDRAKFHRDNDHAVPPEAVRRLSPGSQAVVPDTGSGPKEPSKAAAPPVRESSEVRTDS